MNIYKDIIEWWKGFNLDTPSKVDKYLNNFRILFAYNSGKIENNEISFHDTREIFENGKVINYSGTTRTIFELENQKKCYEVLKSKIANKEQLSLNLIKELHLFLTYGTYDEVGLLAKDVEVYLIDLIEEIQEYKGTNFINVAAYLHAMFEYIHPFASGNGRVDRTLLNYYLMINNHSPLIIYEKDKNIYYDCLEKFDKEEELNPLIEFLKYEVEETWKNSLNIRKTKRKSLNDFEI